MRNAIALACVLVAELVQQNRELVAAQPGQRVALPQARLEPARHRDEQLVADEVAEAVVDDLEAIEIEIERRESAGRAAVALNSVEPASEAFHEDRAVARARSADRGIRRCGAVRARSLARSCRSAILRCGSIAAAAPCDRDAAAEEPPVGAVLVADPVLVLKVIGLAGEMRLERCLERSDVVRHGRGRTSPRDDRPAAAAQTEHRPPAAGEVELLGPKIPLPQPVVRAFRRQREPLLASLERAVSARVRSVMSCQSSVTPPPTGSNLTCRIRAPRQQAARQAQASGQDDSSGRRRSRAGCRSCSARAPHQRSNDPARVRGDSRGCVRAHHSRASPGRCCRRSDMPSSSDSITSRRRWSSSRLLT